MTYLRKSLSRRFNSKHVQQITKINELKTLKHISYECKCRFGGEKM